MHGCMHEAVAAAVPAPAAGSSCGGSSSGNATALIPDADAAVPLHHQYASSRQSTPLQTATTTQSLHYWLTPTHLRWFASAAWPSITFSSAFLCARSAAAACRSSSRAMNAVYSWIRLHSSLEKRLFLAASFSARPLAPWRPASRLRIASSSAAISSSCLRGRWKQQ